MCDFVGPRMYGGHVDAGRCPPLVGCGLCGLEGLAAWQPGIQSPSPAGSAQLLPRSRNEAQQKSPYQGDPQLAS